MNITTRRELIERLKNVALIEQRAAKAYEADIATFTNFKIVDTIKAIRQDEERHIALLNELISMLEK